MLNSKLDFKYYVIFILLQTLLFALATCAIFPYLERNYKQLEFHSCSEYQYIFETTKGINENNYLNCTQKIQFSEKQSLEMPLYVETLMQISSVTYDHASPFLLQNKLNHNELAISSNVAKKYNLSVGSCLYSKHKVNNEIIEYKIKELLPICYGLIQSDTKLNYGVIIMGADENYIQNVDYPFIGFAKNDPSSIIASQSAGLISINNKDDYISKLTMQTLISQTIISLIVCFLIIIACSFHYQSQKSYYSRLAIIGYQPKKLNTLFMADMLLPSLISSILAFMLACTILSISNVFFSYITSIIATFASIITLGISAIIFRIKMKRV